MRKILASLFIMIMSMSSLVATPKAIVFDFGGVLTGEANREAVVSFICQSLHLSAEQFEKANQEKRLAIKEGMSDEEFWVSYASKQDMQLPLDWRESFRGVMKEAIGMNPQMFLLVDELKQQQFIVALFSNVDARIAKVICDCGGYAPFDPCILSHEIGLEKPDIKAYEFLLNTLDLPGSEVVFIDDRVENVEAAKIVGIDAILFTSEQQLRNELAYRGILETVGR